MTSIEFEKMCQPYNLKYRDIFGYVPCRGDYTCGREDYFKALHTAVEKKIELCELVTKRKNVSYTDYNILY